MVAHMLRKIAGSVMLFVLSVTSLFADENLCIAGDAVRLRAEPSTSAQVLREYYFGDRIYSEIASIRRRPYRPLSS